MIRTRGALFVGRCGAVRYACTTVFLFVPPSQTELAPGLAGTRRRLIGAIQNVADVDRMGALALLHVAKIARRRHPGRALPEEVNGDRGLGVR